MSSHFLLPKLYYGLKLNDKKQWINFTPNTQNKTNSPPLYQLEVELSRWTLKWSKKKKKRKKKSNLFWFCMFWILHQPISLLCMWLCECVESVRSFYCCLSKAGRQWWGHSAGRIKAVTTGAAASASADRGSCAVCAVLRSQLHTSITLVLFFH